VRCGKGDRDGSCQRSEGPTQQKPLPAPNCDVYRLAETLKADELAVVKQVRALVVASFALRGIEE
jgi:hypothetical protein